MNQTISLILLILLSGACTKNRVCDEPDENLGLIVEPISNLCLPALGSETFVIRDLTSFQQLFPSATCIDRASIDFSQYSLLGFLVAGRGCSVQFIREVRLDKDAFLYVYEVKTETCGTCSDEAISYNWVLVPRLLPDWTVRFVAE